MGLSASVLTRFTLTISTREHVVLMQGKLAKGKLGELRKLKMANSQTWINVAMLEERIQLADYLRIHDMYAYSQDRLIPTTFRSYLMHG
jgi:hypothetical protein